jgi:ribosome-binding protein aMBF1 (putative translation factor)
MYRLFCNKPLVSNESTDTIERNRERIAKRVQLRESQNIAVKVLDKLDQLEWSQKLLAQKMNITPEKITKIVSGKYLLSLEIQVKLMETLKISNLATINYK